MSVLFKSGFNNIRGRTIFSEGTFPLCTLRISSWSKKQSILIQARKRTDFCLISPLFGKNMISVVH